MPQQATHRRPLYKRRGRQCVAVGTRTSPRNRACEKSYKQRIFFATKKLKPHFHCSQQFSIVALTNGSGAITERYAFSAYGKPVFCNARGTDISASAEDNRILYTGREWDAELNLYHFRARLYDVGVGKFLGRDSFGLIDGFGLHHFLVTALLEGSDPTGHMVLMPENPLHGGNSFPEVLIKSCPMLKQETDGDCPCKGELVSMILLTKRTLITQSSV